MKKLLVLLLVLGIASAASATITLTSSAGTELAPSDTTIIGIYNDTAAAGQAPWSYLVIESADTAFGSWTGASTLYYPPLIADSTVYTYHYGVISYGDTWLAQLSPPSAAVIAIGTLADFDFHCDGAGDVVITLYASDITTVIDTITISQVAEIPEPMTMALLGLGGLFLRRRK